MLLDLLPLEQAAQAPAAPIAVLSTGYRSRRQVLRRRSELDIRVGVTGSGAIHDTSPIGVTFTAGRSAVRHTISHSIAFAAIPERAYASRRITISPEVTGSARWASTSRTAVDAGALTRHSGGEGFRLVDPDELLLLDLL